MEYPVTEIQQINQEPPPRENVDNTDENDDGINFQKFIYELFEKNGVLNDLRAHLRGHIITVLKSTGDQIPKCQKNFVQRLEYPFQAINMLIAEYFLRMNFNYSLSVFVSEMPLSNMAFDFAKSLLQLNPKQDFSNMTFKDSDIWSVLNYLGIQMDSEYAHKIREMYRQEEISLLGCLLKCITLAGLQAYQEPTPDDVSSATSTSARSAESKLSGRSRKRAYKHDKCSHYLFCQACRRRVARLKDKYKMKKIHMEKITQEKSAYSKDMEEFMKNLSTLEKNLISEIFAQMKSVYDAEVEMVKTEEQKKVKRSLGSLILQLRQKKAEMEESYGARVEELERSVEEKKRFLWNLARGLRAQHGHMARAMHRVRHETRRLTQKETLLKGQLLKAEEVIRRRGEQVREQISDELLALTKHLDSVRTEKELLKRERSELEEAESNYRLLKLSNAENNYEDLQARYDSLKTELAILKKYIDTVRTDNKTTSETSTNTAAVAKEGSSLNNEQDVGMAEDRRAPNLVVNDLKKLKNVNFAQVNESIRSCAVSTSEDNQTQTQMSEASEREYRKLQEFAVMQREQMERLTGQYARLQSELALAKGEMRSRPQTAPPRLEPFYITLHKASTSAALSNGAGEELSPLSEITTHRILVPGDTLPFVGVVGNAKDPGSRKHLINQWRTLRHISPVSKTRVPSPSREGVHVRPSSAHPKLGPKDDDLAAESAEPKVDGRPGVAEMRKRENSPKSMLREAKARLRNKDIPKKHQPSQGAREKSPTAVLREAKMRLRKLQIEAEAVEKSYKDFRKKQASNSGSKLESGYSSPQTKAGNVLNVLDASQASRKSCNKILEDYSDRYEAYFKNRNASSLLATPVPKEMTQLDRANKLMNKINENYLDTPLSEFRKLYRCQNMDSPNQVKRQSSKQTTSTIVLQQEASNGLQEKYITEKINREVEIEILQQNINKIYNLEEPNASDKNPVVTIHQAESTEWEKSEPESKNDGSGAGKIELKVSLVCEDDESVTKPAKTKLTVDLNSGLMVECSTDTEVEEFISSREKALRFDPTLPMKTSLLADMESFKKQEKSRQSPNSEFLMFIGSSVANVKDSSLIEGPVEYEATRILKETPTEEKAATVEKRRSPSPEQEANITRKDVLEAIYNTQHEDQSNEENGDTDQDGSGGYADDFSADIGNYHANNNMDRSNEDSPHSVSKSEDNFWDS